MSDEDSQPPEYEYDRRHATGEFPAFQPPPPPAAQVPEPPAWQTGADALPVRRRGIASVAIGLPLAVAIALAVVFSPVGDWFRVTGTPTAQAAEPAAQAAAGAPAGGEAAPGAGKAAVNLLRSAVFVQSNFPEGNFVVAYSRDAAGRLSKVGEYPTGGNGSGSFEDASNGLVLGSSEGELAPINNTVVNGTPKGDLLFALNAGSNTVTVFKVEATGLRRVGVTPTGGEKPVSITVNRGLVYVLNSGEFDDRLLPEGVAVPPENCTTGQLPTLTGFKVGKDGVLTPLPGSTRLLSGEKDSGCAQVSFTPNGKTLVVTERIAGKSEPAAPGGFAKGAILTYPVRSDGRLGTVTLNEPVGNGPFGFTFTRDGKIIMTEQNGAFSNPAGGYMASYRMNPPETQVDPNFGIPNVALTPVSQPLKTNTADPCWVVLTGDQKLAFVTSAGGDVSSYSVGFDGKLTLLHKSATAADGQDTNADRLQFGATDLSLSADSRYLYQLHSFEGRIYVFLINGNGTLTFVETQDAFDLGTRPRNEGSPFGIVAN